MAKKHITKAQLEDLDLTEQDLRGGLDPQEITFVQQEFQSLVRKREAGTQTVEETVLMEVVYSILKNPDRNLDWDMSYHRRVGFIKANKETEIV